MGKYASNEAYYQRLQQLAEVKKIPIKETRNLGTLIDYKRAADGVAYGIVKEQHQYYIKKAGIKENPDVSDFAYIGGLENITEYQYKKLSEADKNRSMILNTINEAVSLKPSKTGSKKRLNEDKAGEEIEMASSKVGDLEAATDVADEPIDVPAEPAPEGGEGLPVSDVPEEPAPEGGDEVDMDVDVDAGAPEGGDELPAEEPAPEGEEGEAPEGEEGEDSIAPDDEKSLTIKEIEKGLGKVTSKIRRTELEPAQIKSYVNSFLSAFKDKFDDVEIEDRKVMADKILKVVSDDEIEDVSNTVSQDGGIEEVEEEVCAECGGFGKYMESRGYSQESIAECGEEEMASVVSGYANAHNDGMNDGDFEAVALFVTPEMLGKLKNEYGHDEYAEKLTPYVNQLGESTEEEKEIKLNEFWGGLKNLAKGAGQGIQKGAQAVGGAVQKGAQAVGGAVQKGAQAGAEKVGQAATAVKQQYYKGEVNPAVKAVEKEAETLGKKIANLNNTLTKAGQQPVNVRSILATIQNQLGAGAGANLGKFGVAAEGMTDPANVEVQPNTLKEEEESEIETDNEENAEVEFAPDSQSLGAGVIKPESISTTGVDVNVDAQNKTVNVSMNEGKKRINEKWDTDYKTPESEKGKYKGKTLEDLEKIKSNLDKKRPEGGYKKGSPEYEKEKEINFAIRAKKGWKGGVDENREMSESEQKLRKYIRNHLEEKAGLRKPSLNESKKSETLKKLDAIINEQLKLYESAAKKRLGENVEEGIGDFLQKGMVKVGQMGTGKGKLQKELRSALPTLSPEEYTKWLQDLFSVDTMYNKALERYINTATTENKQELLQQIAADKFGVGKLSLQNGRLVYIPADKA